MASIFETTIDRFSSRPFSPVVQAFVGAVYGAGAKVLVGDTAAAQLFSTKTFGMGVLAPLYQDFQQVTVRIQDLPEPVDLATDREENVVVVPLVGRGRTVAPDLCCNLCSRTVRTTLGSFRRRQSRVVLQSFDAQFLLLDRSDPLID
ncbi:hypothetical protein P775_04845 [Puniceibacterium antarcticum]|uniref:Uncharacterized protein n=1 Tax=Puniceibacterium antarcticum TaxID=1206336 RepID=A0A2G8RID2_9RHOB|nr:hypothetical protein [Puniceibacterium antarcticum]PIL21319.1 hypothetical protein P775_04845 [Puniceibacterium antarcticum]